jgi:predicted phosphatase
MEESMSSDQLPKTDSIAELASFWDTHDLTDFEDALEEVSEPIFEQQDTFVIPLNCDIAQALRQVAKSKGFPASTLIQHWIAEKLQSSDVDTTSRQ